MSVESNFAPFQSIDIFRHTAQFMTCVDVCRSGQVCQLWEHFSNDPSVWHQFFIEEGIPFVKSENGQPRNLKCDFSVLCPMTFGLKMSKKYFGDVTGKMPCISSKWVDMCSQEDPFKPGKLMKNTFKFLVFPDVFVRTFCQEGFPCGTDKDGNLKEPSNIDFWQGRTVKFPNTLGNLKTLCDHPLEGKEHTDKFEYFVPDTFRHVSPCLQKISVFFMRTCIADETRNLRYFDQAACVNKKGFEVAGIEERAFFDAICLLSSGTCPDTDRNHARTSSSFMLPNAIVALLNTPVAQIGIGCCSEGMLGVDFTLVDPGEYTGVVPCVSAEALPPSAPQ